MKEWKGNADAVRSRIAVRKGDHTTKGREQDDFYATDPVALEKLLNNCSEWLNGIFGDCASGETSIWECACGNGNLAKVLQDGGYNVIASDLKDRGFGVSGLDFLKICAPVGVFAILTNPPYSLATEFAEHALQILPEGGVYVALMSINYLAGQKRYNYLYSKMCLREVYVFSKRIGCWKNNEPANHPNTMQDYAWFVFQKGYSGQPTLYWL